MRWLILALLFYADIAAALPISGHMTAVDGDSLELETTRIRLDGIDAPEFFQTCYTAAGEEYACGQAATDYLRELIADQTITCDCLPAPDKYGRQICECFVGNISLNRQMVAVGLARTYRSTKYAPDEDAARLAKLGIWQGKHMRPALYRILYRLVPQTQP